MSEQPFKVGDLVRLKSGSPVMTVGLFKENGDVRCGYWDQQKAAFDYAQFPPAMLMAVSREEATHKAQQEAKRGREFI
jgi:uncharacterized protein YodC (DUF2158 family)